MNWFCHKMLVSVLLCNFLTMQIIIHKSCAVLQGNWLTSQEATSTCIFAVELSSLWLVFGSSLETSLTTDYWSVSASMQRCTNGLRQKIQTTFRNRRRLIERLRPQRRWLTNLKTIHNLCSGKPTSRSVCSANSLPSRLWQPLNTVHFDQTELQAKRCLTKVSHQALFMVLCTSLKQTAKATML